jgi:AP-2 complex subunit mu-1
VSDLFRIHVVANTNVKSPIITLGSTSFYHIKYENLYLVAVTKNNANTALVFEFLYKIAQLGDKYFNKFDEDSVKNNFTLIYELMDGEFDIL